jgi:ABC-type nitrate/sulfonate/bicarbonate transport system substrate-binding protein
MKLAMKVACLPVFLVSVLVPSLSRAQTKMKLAYSSITANQAPFWIAWDRGLFKKNGLDVEMIFIEGGSRVVQAMVAGDTPIAHVGATPIASGNLRGADLVMCAATVNKILFQFFVAKEITRPEDLRGKKFAISRFGSSSDFALRAALKALGLDPRKDVAICSWERRPCVWLPWIPARFKELCCYHRKQSSPEKKTIAFWGIWQRRSSNS